MGRREGERRGGSGLSATMVRLKSRPVDTRSPMHPAPDRPLLHCWGLYACVSGVDFQTLP